MKKTFRSAGLSGRRGEEVEGWDGGSDDRPGNEESVRRHERGPSLITDAPRSPEEDLRRRQTRYVVMMLIRTGCLVAGGVLISVQAPWLPLWLSLCATGMVILPWLAVILANDGPPKEKHRMRRPTDRIEPGPVALPAAQAPPTIDYEP